MVGTFDGVHPGHRHLLAELKAQAYSRGLTPLALTFDRHPLELIAPERVPRQLCSPAERIGLLQGEGVDAQMLPFTPALRRMTAKEFLGMLHEKYDVDFFLLGFNNHIGADRVGMESPLLNEIASGSRVEIAGASEWGSFSSSAVREALDRGDAELATRLLGRPYSIEGEVVSGRQLGRTLGFPTANLQCEPMRAIPAVGTYVGRVQDHLAVVNVGRRPTVESSAEALLSIEAHILDYHGNLYGRRITLEFLHRLRDEKRFGSLEELKKAIAADVKAAREYDESAL